MDKKTEMHLEILLELLAGMILQHHRKQESQK